jgi:hypothetical protein
MQVGRLEKLRSHTTFTPASPEIAELPEVRFNRPEKSQSRSRCTSSASKNCGALQVQVERLEGL